MFFLLLVFLLVVNIYGAEEGTGAALQLYSAWTDSPPKINGNLTDATNNAGSAVTGTDPDEWDDAYCRKITITNGSTTSEAYIFLMNDANYLYIGIAYEDGNASNGDFVTLYFDGDNSGTLGTTNENCVRVERQSSEPDDNTTYDRYWNGTAWVDDSISNFTDAEGFQDRPSGGNYYNYEFKIPLADDANNQDLPDVNGGNGTDAGDEVGFFFEMHDGGGTGTWYWQETNMISTNPATSPGWADIRLGKPKSFMKFYATPDINGTPNIDGSICEDAWRGCWQRDVVLTDFSGNTLNGKFYFVQDADSDRIYFAAKIYDTTQDSSDFLQIYQEQKNPSSAPETGRDYELDDGQENALLLTGGNALNDLYWSNGAPGKWAEDTDGGGGNSGSANYSTDHWEFELAIEDYDNGANTEDLDRLSDRALIGFQVKYVDITSGNTYWWQYSTNCDYELVDETDQRNMAVGWAYLQLGAPYLQIVHPDDGTQVEGTYPIDVFAKSGTGVLISSVAYQVEGDTAWTQMEKVGSTTTFSYWWSADWNTTGKADGTYELRVRAVDENGLDAVQIISVDINNSGTSGSLPTVDITAPSAGSTVYGITTITFTVTLGSGGTSITDTEISIDGEDYINVDNSPPSGGGTGSHSITTTDLSNGSHIVRIRAEQDNSGRYGYSEVLLVVVDNSPSVSITMPLEDTLLSGTTFVYFVANPVSPAVITQTQISIDGASWVSVSSAPPSGGGTGYHVWFSTMYIDGTHTIQIRAKDNNNRYGYSQTKVIKVDNTPPEINRIKVEYPSGQSMAKSNDKILITSEITDSIAGVKVSSVLLNSSNLDGTIHTLVDDGTNGDEVSGDNVYSYEITVSASGTGMVNFTISAQDNLGNLRTLTGSVALDNTPPSISINSVVSPTKFPAQTITGNFVEANLDTIRVNGIQADVSGNSYSAVIPLLEGKNTISAYIKDEAGNIEITTATIFYDPNSPISIISPETGEKIKGSISVEVIAREITQEVWFEVSPDNGITWYSLSGTLGEKTTDFTYMDGWKQNWDSSLLSDATGYQIRVYSYSSEASTPVISATVSEITVDNTAPVVDFSTASFTPLPKLIGTTYYIYTDEIRVAFYAIDATAGMGSVKITSLNDNGDRIFYADVIPADDGEVIQYLPLVEGKNEISVKARDSVENEASEVKVTVYYIEPKQSAVIGTSGGTVQSPDETKIVIPEGALVEETKITITLVDEEELPKPVNTNVELIGVARDFGPDGTVFNKPVEITIPYAEADLDKDLDGNPDFDESKLEIYFWDGWDWLKVGCKQRDTAKNLITALVNHFTIFAIGEDVSQIPQKVKIYLTKNPFKAETGTTFVYDLPEDAKVKISIYDLSGDRVVELAEINQTAGTRSLFWKGDNEFGRYIGSGIYFYVFEAEFSTGKKEVIKDLIGVIK